MSLNYTRFLAVLGVGLLAAVMVGCSCGDSKSQGAGSGAACSGANSLEGCGQTCGSTGAAFCPNGLYCSDKDTCTADCHFGGPNANECGEGNTCTFNGRCVATGGGDSGSGGLCPSVKLDTLRKTPNIMILLDRSGSMTEMFDKDPDTNRNRDRWTALRDLLIGKASKRPGGILYDFQASARIGLTMYDGKHDGGYTVDPNATDPYLTSCVRLVKTPIAPNNYDAIVASYAPAQNPPAPSGDTPTGPSIHLLAPDLPVPTPGGDPTILVLATDGSPDNCILDNPGQDADKLRIQKEVVDKVEQICGPKKEDCPEGIRTYVIGVATTSTTNKHLQQVANVGIGRDRTLLEGNPNAAPKFIANNGTEFLDQLRGIIGGAVTCNLKLSSPVVPSQACTGKVTLNGKLLDCDSDNGWRIDADGAGFQLTGSACAELKATADPKVEGEFPCDAVQVI